MSEESTTSTPRFAADAAGLPPRPESVQLRARRNPRFAAIGVLLLCLGGLGAAFLYSSATTSNTVLMLAHTVNRGQVLQQADLKVITVGAVPGVATVAGDRAGEFVGKTALVDLAEGSLLGAAAVGTPVVPANTAQLGLKLTAGRIPTGSLPAGSKVQLIQLDEKATATTKSFAGVLLTSPTTLLDGQTYVVDVRVSDAVSNEVAALAAFERIALIRLADN